MIICLLGLRQAFASGIFLDPSKSPSADESSPAKERKKDVHIVARQLLISFESEDNKTLRDQIAKKYQARELDQVGSSPLYLFEFPEGSDLQSLQKDISEMPGVRYSEPNLKMRIMETGSQSATTPQDSESESTPAASKSESNASNEKATEDK